VRELPIKKCLNTREYALHRDPAIRALHDYVRSATADPPPVAPVPESLGSTGLDAALIEQLVLKYLYFRGDLAGREIANLMGLQFSLIEGILE